MATYPLQFEIGRTKAGPDDEPRPPEHHGPKLNFTISLEPQTGQECHRFRLAEIKGWPETKVVMEQKCVTVFGHRMCTDVPRLYHRSCVLYVYVEVCYPTGMLNEVTQCVTSAALAGAVAAVISGGAAVAGAFKVALEACLLAKGQKWADKISVGAGTDSDCGPWHPV